LKDVGDRVEIVRCRNIFVLNIYDIRPDDHGTYACLVVNPTGEKCLHFNLFVVAGDAFFDLISTSFLKIKTAIYLADKAPSLKSQSIPSIKLNFQLPDESFEEDKPKDLNFEVSGVPEARIVALKNGQVNC